MYVIWNIMNWLLITDIDQLHNISLKYAIDIINGLN